MELWTPARRSVLEPIPAQVFQACFLEMEQKGYDVLYPFGNSDKLDDDETMKDELGDIPVGTSLSFEDHAEIEIMKEGKHSPLVDVGDGKMILKARVLRELERAMFSKIPGSTDRLTRVAGGTRFHQQTADPTTLQSDWVFGASTLCVGDPASTIVV